jgi:hypothetical protein
MVIFFLLLLIAVLLKVSPDHGEKNSFSVVSFFWR